MTKQGSSDVRRVVSEVLLPSEALERLNVSKVLIKGTGREDECLAVLACNGKMWFDAVSKDARANRKDMVWVEGGK